MPEEETLPTVSVRDTFRSLAIAFSFALLLMLLPTVAFGAADTMTNKEIMAQLKLVEKTADRLQGSSLEALYQQQLELERILTSIRYQINVQESVARAHEFVRRRRHDATASASVSNNNQARPQTSTAAPSLFTTETPEPTYATYGYTKDPSKSASAWRRNNNTTHTPTTSPSISRGTDVTYSATTTDKLPTETQETTAATRSRRTTTQSVDATTSLTAATPTEKRKTTEDGQSTTTTTTPQPSSSSTRTSRRIKGTKHGNRTVICQNFSEEELISELKDKGTYNPDFMAWDVSGVIRFLEKTVDDKYDRTLRKKEDANAALEKNLNALERILRELRVDCDIRSPETIAKLYNLTYSVKFERRHGAAASTESPTADDYGRLRTRRDAHHRHRTLIQDPVLRNRYLHELYLNPSRDDVLPPDDDDKSRRQSSAAAAASSIVDFDSDDPPAFTSTAKRSTGENADKRIGLVHIVPFGCDKRGAEEDGYLRLCGACQAIRRLPDDFFPPFINEVTCDQDKACLYFYDYPHGKCKQKHMNFIVLRNVGSKECQVWRKFNLSVRVSCECFVDEMSFFAKYV